MTQIAPAARRLPFDPCCLPMTPSQWPHREVGRVVAMVVAQAAALQVPAFPKLEKLSLSQVTEGMPCLIVDKERDRVGFDTSDPGRVEAELITFYEHYLADDLPYFAISPEASPGLHPTLEALKGHCWKGRFISTGLFGPVSFSMRTTDEKERPIFYNEALRDAIVKTLCMKARWLHRKVSEAAPEATVGCRFAEPLLSLYGSAFTNLPHGQVMAVLNECLEAVPGPAIVHCCANIDWPILYESAADIIHFDAFEYADKLALYPAELKAYLNRGGMLSWGIVPSSNDRLLGETVESLIGRLERGLAVWEAHGLDRNQVLRASFIQTSCSLTTMTEELAERAFHYTNEIAARLRARYFPGELVPNCINHRIYV